MNKIFFCAFLFVSLSSLSSVFTLAFNPLPPEQVSVPSHFQFEMLDLTLRAEDALQKLQENNISDAVLHSYLKDMYTVLSPLGFSRIVSSVSTEYHSPRDPRRQRMETLIYPLSGKREPTMADYNSLKSLSDQLNRRVQELEQIKTFYLFIQEELSRQKDNPIIVTDEELALFTEIEKHYTQQDYDWAKEHLLLLKTTLDTRALQILKIGYDLIIQAQHDQFSTQLLQDVFSSAQDELTVAYYSAIINQTTDPAMLAFLDKITEDFESKPGDEYTSIDYRAVQSLINQINFTVMQIYRINASLTTVGKKLEDYSLESINISEPQELYVQAFASFSEERYDEAESLVSRADSSLELSRVQATITGVLARESIGFMKQHRFFFSFLAVFLVLFGPVIFRRSRLAYVDHRITSLQLEHDVLIDLIKKAQHERYEQGSLDFPTYNTKMDKYMERLSKIDTDLPVQRDIYKRAQTPTTVEHLYGHVKNLLHKKTAERKR